MSTRTIHEVPLKKLGDEFFIDALKSICTTEELEELLSEQPKKNENACVNLGFYLYNEAQNEQVKAHATKSQILVALELRRSTSRYINDLRTSEE